MAGIRGGTAVVGTLTGGGEGDSEWIPDGDLLGLVSANKDATLKLML